MGKIVKILVISDLHYNKRIFHGVDESKAWSWLMEIIDYCRPDYLLSCGDCGEAINFGEFYELLKKTSVLSIFGNHENMDVLTHLYNTRANNYLPVLMKDRKVYKFNNLSIAGISGIIAKKKKVKKGVPRRTPEDFLEVARSLEGKNVDILLLHEAPFLPKLFPFMAHDFRSLTALEVIKIVKPRLVINGHMHYGGFKTYIFSWGTRYIYTDSSQQNRYYLILYTGSKLEVEVWKDFEKVGLIELTS